MEELQRGGTLIVGRFRPGVERDGLVVRPAEPTLDYTPKVNLNPKVRDFARLGSRISPAIGGAVPM